MWRKIKTIWSVITGNMITGYMTIGVLKNGHVDLICSSYKPKNNTPVDYDKAIILPQGTIVFIPRLTEGRVETPDEYNLRILRSQKK